MTERDLAAEAAILRTMESHHRDRLAEAFRANDAAMMADAGSAAVGCAREADRLERMARAKAQPGGPLLPNGRPGRKNVGRAGDGSQPHHPALNTKR